ncbi:hypothetical protein M8C13_04315 [Crossiella sp. SN42]|uniref:hypothetical protein n=1 Tax=Crossiella sp. SN42 TaxID=2944808 RepID=UPI00207D0E7B|nr:hypothetical protein [Crossiella sp. SN42]MCO1574982.1 hypothetical protein [Crossiella sp. SN42]
MVVGLAAVVAWCAWLAATNRAAADRREREREARAAGRAAQAEARAAERHAQLRRDVANAARELARANAYDRAMREQGFPPRHLHSVAGD